MVAATTSHPYLPNTTSTNFQDGYPFLVTSVESLEAVQETISILASDEGNGLQVPEWRMKKVTMERRVILLKKFRFW